jgi:hydroxymethylbilane synthase
MHQSRQVLRLGTRTSPLALWQAHAVQAALTARGMTTEIVGVRSEGDTDLTSALTDFAQPGIFTKALDDALLAGTIDLAVHSCKDLPTVQPEGVVLAATLVRGDTSDALVLRHPETKPDDLPATHSWLLGTGSRRRRAQWLARFPDSRFEELRGTMHTRLHKATQTHLDGGFFAAIALERLNLAGAITLRLPWMLPAPGQGAVAICCRTGDLQCLAQAEAINHGPTYQAVTEERRFLNRMEAGCTAPVGALCQPLASGHWQFSAIALKPDGSASLHETRTCTPAELPGLGEAVAEALLARGAAALIHTP